MSRLDKKLKKIAAGDFTPQDFIIADAKDGDMGFGASCPGPRGDGSGTFKTLADYVTQMRAIIDQDVVDIMLTSVTVFELLSDQGVYERTEVTPAVRLNDTTDIWSNRHGIYGETPSIPTRSARLEEVRRLGVPIGLYSMTFNNDTDADARSMMALRRFRAASATWAATWACQGICQSVMESPTRVSSTAIEAAAAEDSRNRVAMARRASNRSATRPPR